MDLVRWHAKGRGYFCWGKLRRARRTRKLTVARSLEWVSTIFGKVGGQLDRRRARGVLNLCAREPKARSGRFLRGKLISDHGLFSSCESQQWAANGQNSGGIFQGCTGLWTTGFLLTRRLHYESQQWAANVQNFWGIFQGCTGLWTTRCLLARRLHYQLKASTAMAWSSVRHFPYFCLTWPWTIGACWPNLFYHLASLSVLIFSLHSLIG